MRDTGQTNEQSNISIFLIQLFPLATRQRMSYTIDFDQH